MKRTRTILVLGACAAMSLTSCHKNDTTVPNSDNAVRFTSGITATPGSRATIDADGNSVWEAGDPVGIYMVGKGTTTVTDGAANVKYTAEQVGTATTLKAADAAIYYPLDETAAVDFIAYHPYNATVADFAYPVDLSNQTSQTAIDLMTASANNNNKGYTKADGRASTAVDFAFTHRLVKLVMNVTKHASVPDAITAVSITGMNTTATFDLRGTDGLTAEGTPAAITPCTVDAGKRYEAVLLPVATLTAAHTVTFTTSGNETYVWEMSKDIPKLEAGKIYAYDVTVTKHAVTANGSINPWDKGTSGSGVAQ